MATGPGAARLARGMRRWLLCGWPNEMPEKSRSLFPELEELAPHASTGILPSQDIERLIKAGAIRSAEAIPAAQIQPSSLDLRVGPIAYQVEASFLPEGFKP